MSNKEIITFCDRNDFVELLKKNPNILVLKFGSDVWCGPCKKIRPIIDNFFASTPDDVLICDFDVDENFDLYAFMKSKRVVNGIPVLLAYVQGNHNPLAPDCSVVGINPDEIDTFFRKLGAIRSRLNQIKTNIASRPENYNFIG